jgi:hypothetical protein
MITEAKKTAFIELVKKFEAVQDKFRSNGAWDTEPSWHFKNAMYRAMIGREFKPLDARGWELYSSVAGGSRAAAQLNTAAKRVANMVSKMNDKEKAWVRDYYGLDY